MDKRFRIVFMGTPEFAVPSLKALIETGEDIAAVVTQPDKPRGRGKRLAPPPVKELALQRGIPVLQPEKMRDETFINAIKKLYPDIIVVIAYGKILPKAILDIPPKGCINVHASLLPKYRGAAPINWAIINGEKETGITTMLMDEGMDTGKILLKKSVPISQDDTTGTLHDKLIEIGTSLLIETIEGIRHNRIISIEQDNSIATYAPMLKKEDCHINWNKDAISIKNLVRGLNPVPCAYTYLDDMLLKIYNGRAVSKDVNERAGTIIDISSEGIEVATGRGIFVIKELKPANRNRMTAEGFLRGYRIDKGRSLN